MPACLSVCVCISVFAAIFWGGSMVRRCQKGYTNARVQHPPLLHSQAVWAHCSRCYDGDATHDALPLVPCNATHTILSKRAKHKHWRWRWRGGGWVDGPRLYKWPGGWHGARDLQMRPIKIQRQRHARAKGGELRFWGGVVEMVCLHFTHNICIPYVPHFPRSARWPLTQTNPRDGLASKLQESI